MLDPILIENVFAESKVTIELLKNITSLMG